MATPTKLELQKQLHDEFIVWFFPKYEKWEDQVIEKFKPKIKEVLSRSSNPSKELCDLDDDFMQQKSEFIKKMQYEYIDVVLDSYNDKKIGKRVLKLFCNELIESIKETEVVIKNMKERL